MSDTPAQIPSNTTNTDVAHDAMSDMTRSGLEELVHTAQGLMAPNELMWQLDCDLKRGKRRNLGPWSNTTLRFVLAYGNMHIQPYQVETLIMMMQGRKIIDDQTRAVLLAYSPSMCAKLGITATVPGQVE